MTYGLDTPQFPDTWDRLGWFSSIFNYVRSRVGVTAQSANYTVLENIFWVRMNATAGARTVTLPPAIGRGGRQIGVIKTDASGNNVTVAASAGDAVNGTAALAAQWAAGVFISDGTTNWDRVT